LTGRAACRQFAARTLQPATSEVVAGRAFHGGIW
jgi:hypothetical protein